jgi:hypothetical protein
VEPGGGESGGDAVLDQDVEAAREALAVEHPDVADAAFRLGHPPRQGRSARQAPRVVEAQRRRDLRRRRAGSRRRRPLAA